MTSYLSLKFFTADGLATEFGSSSSDRDHPEERSALLVPQLNTDNWLPNANACAGVWRVVLYFDELGER